MNVITGIETVPLDEFDAMSLDGFNIIYATPEDGAVAEGDNIDRKIRLWADRDDLRMMRLGDHSEGESIQVLHIAVPDIVDEEAIERLRQAVSARMAQS